MPSAGRQWFEALKKAHFWVIVTIMACGTVFYYADSIPLIESAESSLGLDFARRSVHRILSILPVAYAAFAFGLQGGLLASLVIASLLLPRVFPISSEAHEALIEVAAFLFIGAFVSWLIEVQNRERARRKETIVSLEWAERELRSHIQAIEMNQRQLAAVNDISNIVSQSLDLQDILNLAADKVAEVANLETVLIFLVDEGAEELVLQAYRGMSEGSAAGVKRIKVGEGFNGRVAQTGEPLAVEDASHDPRLTRAAVSEERIQAQLIVPVESKGKVLGTLCVATRRPRRFGPEEIDLLSAGGKVIGIAVENARLYQKEREISEQLRQSDEDYRGLFENAQESIFVHSLDGKIMAANRACERLTGYTRAEMASMDIGRFLSGQDLKSAKEIVNRQLGGEAIESPFELRLSKRDGTEAIVELMPSLIIRGDQPVGVQAILRDVTEQRRMQENLRFYLSEVLKAQESERLRIARELHDDTAQALSGLSRRLDMLVDTLASTKNELPPEIPKSVEELREQSDTILEGVRRFSRDLRPPVLADLGVLPAVKWLATALEEQQRIATNIRVLGEQHRLPTDVELALFRIAQETLNNVAKHADASAVDITVDFRGAKITMTIADNGKGFEVRPSTTDLGASGKLGIIGMQERARLLGGTLVVDSQPGAGTSVTVTVPD